MHKILGRIACATCAPPTQVRKASISASVVLTDARKSQVPTSAVDATANTNEWPEMQEVCRSAARKGAGLASFEQYALGGSCSPPWTSRPGRRVSKTGFSTDASPSVSFSTSNWQNRKLAAALTGYEITQVVTSRSSRALRVASTSDRTGRAKATNDVR